MAELEDHQALAEADRTGSEADQTLSDADQTSADADQTSSERDQAAADRDQAASDDDLASGGDLETHESSKDQRERSSEQRDDSANLRDRGAHVRLEAAERRDAIAEDRDVAALARDIAAHARDVAMAQRDAASQQAEDVPLDGSERVVRAAGARKRAIERREQAAEYRMLAAHDRRIAELDREQAAAERRRALLDREALALELQRERQLREEALRHQHRAESLARTLQRSLSPPRLPDVAGLDVAVHHVPVAAEEVGGDFYDLFPLTTGRVGFFFGDVCGKGPAAAADTSLARHTMRTAALLQEDPAAILLILNTALLMQNVDPTQTCTAVCGDIDMDAAPTAVTIAVAGHPPPLIVRSHGAVEAVTAHGTMLGVVADPTLRACKIELQPADALVIYSDGILDTEINGVQADQAQLVSLLSCGAPPASAATLVDRLMIALERIDRPLRDDLAIMALRRTPAP